MGLHKEGTEPPSREKKALFPFFQEDRYSRLRLIPWWDQDKLGHARVMVIGAGALGNEIIKGLALLGIGTMLIVDFDVVETSNLSRSVLFRPEDEGRPKAQAAAQSAMRINPECKAYALNGDITSDVGLGLFRWADVVICGLDNREARLSVNKACWKVNRPWVDGATESIQGVARVFRPPDGPCYECTLSEQDLKVMAARDSCGFLAKEAYRLGHTPTTPTTSAVIAGIQVQEAVKLLHGNPELPTLAGRGFFFDGATYDCFTIEYTRRDDCLSHETYESIVESDLTSDATLADVAAIAAEHLRGQETQANVGSQEVPPELGGDLVIDLPCEMVTELRCTKCGTATEFYRLLKSVEIEEARCPSCGEVRTPEVVYEYTPSMPRKPVCVDTSNGDRAGSGADSSTKHGPGSKLGTRALVELGFGIMDVIPARHGDREVQIEISGDLARVVPEAANIRHPELDSGSGLDAESSSA